MSGIVALIIIVGSLIGEFTFFIPKSHLHPKRVEGMGKEKPAFRIDPG